jgi:hypothetical protein
VIPVDVEMELISVVRIGRLKGADQLCTLQIKMPPEKKFMASDVSKPVPHFDPA